MAWDCEQTIQGNIRTVLPCPFNSRALAIDITANNQQPTWYQSGFLRVVLDVDGTEFIGLDIKTVFGQQIIEVPFIDYKVEFTPRVWLDSTTIKIKQLSSTQIGNTYMSVSYEPIERATGAAVVTTVLVSVTNIIVAPANLDRAPGSFIINNSSKNMWVSCTGTAATAAAPATKIPPNGGSFDIPESYTGAVNAIWSSGANASCVVNEFSYI